MKMEAWRRLEETGIHEAGHLVYGAFALGWGFSHLSAAPELHPELGPILGLAVPRQPTAAWPAFEARCRVDRESARRNTEFALAGPAAAARWQGEFAVRYSSGDWEIAERALRAGFGDGWATEFFGAWTRVRAWFDVPERWAATLAVAYRLLLDPTLRLDGAAAEQLARFTVDEHRRRAASLTPQPAARDLVGALAGIAARPRRRRRDILDALLELGRWERSLRPAAGQR